ncbi:chromosome partitioning protein ParB [Photobacterium proteolyticum]|uniref:Chromosome partitioning protein ParB n=1 Tax=Photobacterium proteolyticum TaxID=1903952 RepID=A0A1Q9H0R8_9GAMM|nr:chromosome partitioning protein ParB [Photobacterium proteolyticum]OLQ81116.1 chromosome partitioning protein ParB [Photobacterium proteolyticum]
MKNAPNLHEDSLVQVFLEEYAALPETYIASSEELMDNSTRKLSVETMSEIFKSKAKYYPQLKAIDLPIRHEVVHITPTVARDMLRFSRRGAINEGLKNRRIKATTVKRFTNDMNERKWCLTGEPIIIGFDGEIMDGHTRLEAASQSQYGFIAVIIWGVSDQLSFAHIDVGNTRSRAEVLEMSGVQVNARILAQAALLAQCFDNTANKYHFRGTQGNKYQQMETVDYVKQNQEILHSVALVESLAKKYRQEIQASPATYAFAHYLIKKQIEVSEIEEFSVTPEYYLTKIISGIGIKSEEDIEYQVRNYLQTLIGEAASYSLLCRLSAIFKGWNSYLGIPIFGKKIAVRRVAKFTKDDEGNKLPAKGAGNINEPFTVPCLAPGKASLKITKQAAIKIV